MHHTCTRKSFFIRACCGSNAVGQGMARSTACLSDRMSRSEGPFLVALHLTASQVMMKNSEGVLNAANILNVLGVTHCRSRCAVRWQRCCSLGHLEVQGRWVDSFFNGARGGNPPPHRKYCYTLVSHFSRFAHGLDRGVLAAMSTWNGNTHGLWQAATISDG